MAFNNEAASMDWYPGLMMLFFLKSNQAPSSIVGSPILTQAMALASISIYFIKIPVVPAIIPAATRDINALCFINAC